MPQSPSERLSGHARCEHLKSVTLENSLKTEVQFTPPAFEGIPTIEISWRRKALPAFLEVLPACDKTDLLRLCRHGRYKLSSDNEGASEASEATVCNVFEPEDTPEEGAMLESPFYCAEAALWIVLLSCFPGRGKERTAISRTIGPVVKQGEENPPLPYTAYEPEKKYQVS